LSKENAYIEDIDETHRILNVLRLKRGDKVVLFDGRGSEYDGVIVSSSKERIEFGIESERRVEGCGELSLVLVQAVLKSRRMDLIFQKATELGVDLIIPLLSARTERRVISEHQMTRWRRIILEAARQSERTTVPELGNLISFRDYFEDYGERGDCLFFCERRQGKKLGDYFSSTRSKGIQVVVGPEGGWEPSEISYAKDRGFFLATLGSKILRTETAAIVALGIVQYELSGRSESRCS
jgi:16S rRNA (uracil1498-N3)-methyltransferase